MPTDIVNRYPLSTPNGQAIPLDIIKPIALMKITFNFATYVAATDLAASYSGKVFVATTDQDCYISFANSPTVPVSGTVIEDVIYIPAGATVAFVTDSLKLAAIGLSAAGHVEIQICETWAGLAIAAQINRI